MKRFGILFFSSIISSIVLIHVVLPHHHHGDLPCFKNHVDLCCTHHHDVPEKDIEHHDCTSHSDAGQGVSCLFEQALLLNDRNEKDRYSCDICLLHHNNYLIQAILLASNCDLFVPDGEKLTEKPPYLTAYHSIDVNRISGLRAPPVA